ncbi:MAG: MGMT family protein [Syntrophomonadaceae bacterium]|nr:MGMT family protein [Syntrophomonadaceae bacterium]MDD3889756.1 MGMT family protein [Syntrophomonadaceae bacterium]MDD4550152.1 MGMT family protein [Syntrophomonadaceae bacterium]
MCWYVFYTPRGWAAILGEKRTISATVLPTLSPLNIFLYNLQQTGRPTRFVTMDDYSIAVITQIRKYYEGVIINHWDVELDLSAQPDYSRKVLEYVYTIPYGTTRTYSEVAAATSNPRAARAVGQAMRRNPLPLIIPCHRVVAQNGLGGFTSEGGIRVKEEMLSMEKYNLQKSNAPLF